MSLTTASAKSRTVALPHLNKNLLPARRVQDQVRDLDTSESESPWSGMIFGPYLVPLTRRVE